MSRKGRSMIKIKICQAPYPIQHGVQWPVPKVSQILDDRWKDRDGHNPSSRNCCGISIHYSKGFLKTSYDFFSVQNMSTFDKTPKTKITSHHIPISLFFLLYRCQSQHLRFQTVEHTAPDSEVDLFHRPGPNQEAPTSKVSSANISLGTPSDGGSMLFFPQAQKIGSWMTTRHLRKDISNAIHQKRQKKTEKILRSNFGVRFELGQQAPIC